MARGYYKYRIVHIFAVFFAVCMVALGLYVDFHPLWYMNLFEKFIIYLAPMILLFWDLQLHLKNLPSVGEKRNIQRRMMKMIFLIYIIALATLLFLGSTFRAGLSERNIWKVEPFSKDHIKYYLNLELLKSVKMYSNAFVNHTMTLRIIILNMVGNLIAFAPFGFFIPVIYSKKIKNIFSFVLVVALSCITMEFIQFITMVGQADIDDLLLNVMGAVITYLFVYIPPIRKAIHAKLPYGDF